MGGFFSKIFAKKGNNRKAHFNALSEIERYPAQVQRVVAPMPPTMIFFEPDEEAEEAEFILLDDLMQKSETLEIPAEQTAYLVKEDAKPISIIQPDGSRALTFTLIPRHRYQYITATISRAIRATLSAQAKTLGKEIVFLRVRPIYIQWTMTVEDNEDFISIMRAFRQALDNTLIFNDNAFYRDRSDQLSFWSDDCLIQKAENSASHKQLIQFINDYQLD